MINEVNLGQLVIRHLRISDLIPFDGDYQLWVHANSPKPRKASVIFDICLTITQIDFIDFPPFPCFITIFCYTT